MQTKY